MKNALTLSVLTLLMAACGGGASQSVEDLVASKDLEAIRAERSALESQLKGLEDQIAILDSVIASRDENANLPLVSTLTAKAGNFVHFLEFQGDVATKQNVLIYPEMAGILKKIYVKKGQKVSKGQLLASIEDGGLSDQLAQARTQAELASTTFERQKRLWEQNIGSEIQYLQAKAQFEAGTSTVKQLESQVAKTALRAPFSGIIDDLIKEQGTVVAPGQGSEVFRIVNLSNMYLDVEVPESHLPNVTVGKEVKVYFPVLGDSMVSKVRQTSNFIDPANRSFMIEVPVTDNKNGKVKPNLTAKVLVNDYANPKALMIPQGIISENANGEQYVYTIGSDNGKSVAKRTFIETGKTNGDLIEVTQGLKEGDKVIEEGARNVREGQAVQVLAQAVASGR